MFSFQSGQYFVSKGHSFVNKTQLYTLHVDQLMQNNFEFLAAPNALSFSSDVAFFVTIVALIKPLSAAI